MKITKGQTFKYSDIPNAACKILQINRLEDYLTVQFIIDGKTSIHNLNLTHFLLRISWGHYHHFSNLSENENSSTDNLYNHRNWLFINLAKQIANNTDLKIFVWRSWKHLDGTNEIGFFVLGLGIDSPSKNQISYHLPEEHWSTCDFAHTLPAAPWDGHSSADVIERLKLMAQ